jgi:hypothetical protein
MPSHRACRPTTSLAIPALRDNNQIYKTGRPGWSLTIRLPEQPVDVSYQTNYCKFYTVRRLGRLAKGRQIVAALFCKQITE